MTGPEVTQPDPDGGVEMTDGEWAEFRAGTGVTPSPETAEKLGVDPERPNGPGDAARAHAEHLLECTCADAARLTTKTEEARSDH